MFSFATENCRFQPATIALLRKNDLRHRFLRLGHFKYSEYIYILQVQSFPHPVENFTKILEKYT